MLRSTLSKVAPVALKPVLRAVTPRAAAVITAQRLNSTAPPPKEGEEEIVKVVLADSLEWTLSSPPPIHQFDEPPIIVEVNEA